eukprot:COSAG02_NODE_62354_length_266_cov_0.616766_1_plen_45_part_01
MHMLFFKSPPPFGVRVSMCTEFAMPPPASQILSRSVPDCAATRCC